MMKKERFVDSPVVLFEQECKANIAKMAIDENPKKLSCDWICTNIKFKYI